MDWNRAMHCNNKNNQKKVQRNNTNVQKKWKQPGRAKFWRTNQNRDSHFQHIMSGAGVKWHPSVECYHMVSIYYKCENQPSIHQHWDPRGKWSSQCTSRANGLSNLENQPRSLTFDQILALFEVKKGLQYGPLGPILYIHLKVSKKKCPHLNPNFDLFMIKNPLKFPSV